MMYNKFLLMILTMLVVAGPSYADDAHSKSVVTESKARVITPISLTNIGAQGLDFGVIALGTSTASVVVAPAAVVPINVLTGNVAVLSSSIQTAAKFMVGGEDGKAYTITLPASSTISNGVQNLTITNFSCSNGNGGCIGTSDLFFVGGTLLIPESAVPSAYQGTFNITVAYN